MGVTQAQIDAARKAHDAYMAAQKSWDTNKAKQIFSQASQDLWVSWKRANAIYNNPASARSNSQIMADNKGNTSSFGTQNNFNGQWTSWVGNTTTNTNNNASGIQNAQTNTKNNQNFNDVKIWDIVPKFWYETNMAERQDRNQKIAQWLFDSGRDFNEQNTFDEIKTLAPDVTNWEIQHTVNDIRDRFGRLKFISGLWNMDVDSIVGSLNSGRITMNDLSSLKETDPDKYNQITWLIKQQRQIDINNNILDTMKWLYWDDSIDTAFDALDELNKKYQTALSAVDWEEALTKYQSALNDEQLQNDQQALVDNKTSIKEIDEQLNGLKREVEDEFGSNASKSLIASVVADRWANLIREKNSLMIEWQWLADSINNRIANAEQNYKLDLQQEQIARDNILTAYGMDKEMFDKKYEQMQKALDKQEKIEFAKLWMVEQMDLANISEDDIDWMNTAWFVKDLLKFKKKIEWNAWSWTKYNMTTIDWKMVFYDDYGNIKDTYDPSNQSSNIRWTVWWDEMRTDRNNNPTALQWTPWVEAWFKKHGYDVKKWDVRPDGKNYTLDMTGVSDPVKATIDYIDAYTFDYKGKPRRDHTDMSKAERDKKSYEEKRDVVKQMYAHEWGSGKIFGESASDTTDYYNPVMEWFYKKFNTSWWSKLTSADLKQIKDAWYTDKQFYQEAYNWQKAKDAEMTPKAKQLANQLEDLRKLLTDQNWDWLDYQNMRLGTPWTEWRDIRNRFNQIKSSLALQNLVDLKKSWATFWALSDNELNFITNMATHLDKRTTRGTFLKNLNEEIRLLNKWIDWSLDKRTDSGINPFDNDDFIK